MNMHYMLLHIAYSTAYNEVKTNRNCERQLWTRYSLPRGRPAIAAASRRYSPRSPAVVLFQVMLTLRLCPRRTLC